MSATPTGETADTAASPIRLHVADGVAHITLNKPGTLNALTFEMVQIIQRALDEYRDDQSVQVVLIDGAGRAFCSGGDIQALYRANQHQDWEFTRSFWAQEYALNADIASYPKPIVAVMHGIVMGGGVGVSAHASHRIVTDDSKVGMPEVTIGFCPDVGGTYFLARSPGQLGTHAALTGAAWGPADAIALGMADVYIPQPQIGDIAGLLAEHGADDVLARLAVTPPPGELIANKHWIDECYAGSDVEVIVERLAAADSAGAADAHKRLTRNSPTSLKVALRALRNSLDLPSLEAALNIEYRIVNTFVEGTEFREGIRAAVIDKDRNPSWNPATLPEVTADIVDRFFARRDDDIDLQPPAA